MVGKKEGGREIGKEEERDKGKSRQSCTERLLFYFHLHRRATYVGCFFGQMWVKREKIAVLKSSEILSKRLHKRAMSFLN